jgi:cytochrome c oxidase assembly protein subunit 15
MASIFPGLRRVASRSSGQIFIHQQCLKQPRPTLRQLRFSMKANPGTIRFNSSTTTIPEMLGQKKSSPLQSLSESIIAKERVQPAKKSFFPETSSNTVAYWLLGSAASVFGIVVFGGLTRLTESGYEADFTVVLYLLTTTQTEYNRMASCNRIPPPSLPRRLAIRIRQVPRVP